MSEGESVLIVSGESSGELYGALLAREMKARFPGVRIFGVGGERMRAEGVEVFRTVSGAFGLSEALGHLKELRVTFREILKKADEHRPKLAVLIDFPDFNFKVGMELKRRGAKILYYVSPQVWAWRAGRVNKMARFVDRMALILPFEAGIYEMAGIPCEFVGHPVLDEIESMGVVTREAFGLGGGPLVALLPGSRPSELKRHLPVFMETVRSLKKELPGCRYFIPLAPNLDPAPFVRDLSLLESEGVVIRKESALKVLSASDAAVIASGTATLQAAFLGTPFAVIYRVSPLTYFLGRLMLRVRHVALLNILLEKEAVAELLQEKATAGNIVKETRRLLEDSSYRERMKSDFGRMRGMFRTGASARTAEIAAELAGWR